MKLLCALIVGIFLTFSLFASGVPLYIYSDFGGGQSTEPIFDWQTAVVSLEFGLEAHAAS